MTDKHSNRPDDTGTDSAGPDPTSRNDDARSDDARSHDAGDDARTTKDMNDVNDTKSPDDDRSLEKRLAAYGNVLRSHHTPAERTAHRPQLTVVPGGAPDARSDGAPEELPELSQLSELEQTEAKRKQAWLHRPASVAAAFLLLVAVSGFFVLGGSDDEPFEVATAPTTSEVNEAPATAVAQAEDQAEAQAETQADSATPPADEVAADPTPDAADGASETQSPAVDFTLVDESLLGATPTSLPSTSTPTSALVADASSEVITPPLASPTPVPATSAAVATGSGSDPVSTSSAGGAIATATQPATSTVVATTLPTSEPATPAGTAVAATAATTVAATTTATTTATATATLTAATTATATPTGEDPLPGCDSALTQDVCQEMVPSIPVTESCPVDDGWTEDDSGCWRLNDACPEQSTLNARGECVREFEVPLAPCSSPASGSETNPCIDTVTPAELSCPNGEFTYEFGNSAQCQMFVAAPDVDGQAWNRIPTDCGSGVRHSDGVRCFEAGEAVTEVVCEVGDVNAASGQCEVIELGRTVCPAGAALEAFSCLEQVPAATTEGAECDFAAGYFFDGAASCGRYVAGQDVCDRGVPLGEEQCLVSLGPPGLTQVVGCATPGHEQIGSDVPTACGRVYAGSCGVYEPTDDGGCRRTGDPSVEGNCNDGDFYLAGPPARCYRLADPVASCSQGTLSESDGVCRVRGAGPGCPDSSEERVAGDPLQGCFRSVVTECGADGCREEFASADASFTCPAGADPVDSGPAIRSVPFTCVVVQARAIPAGG